MRADRAGSPAPGASRPQVATAALVMLALASLVACSAGPANGADPALEAAALTTTTAAPLFELPVGPNGSSASPTPRPATSTTTTTTTTMTTTTTSSTVAPPTTTSADDEPSTGPLPPVDDTAPTTVPAAGEDQGSISTSSAAMLDGLEPSSALLLDELGLGEHPRRFDAEDQTVVDPLTGAAERLWYARCPEPLHWCIELDLLTPDDSAILGWIDEVRVSEVSDGQQVLVGLGPERRFDVFPSTPEIEAGLRAALALEYGLDRGVFEPRTDFAPLDDFTRRAVEEASTLETVEDVAAWFAETEQPTFAGLRTEFRVRSIVRRDPMLTDVSGWIEGGADTVVGVHLHAEAGESGLDLLVAYTVLRTEGTLGSTS